MFIFLFFSFLFQNPRTGCVWWSKQEREVYFCSSSCRSYHKRVKHLGFDLLVLSYYPTLILLENKRLLFLSFIPFRIHLSELFGTFKTPASPTNRYLRAESQWVSIDRQVENLGTKWHSLCIAYEINHTMITGVTEYEQWITKDRII